MRAIEIREFGEPSVLQPAERPMPVAGDGEVVIRVRAAGVNRPDLLQRQGRYPPPPGASDIPGLEVAGVVEEVGPHEASDPPRWRRGDLVCALVSGGGYAEFVAAPCRQCLPLPPSIDFVRGAAIPETYFTVWTNLFQRGPLKTGDTVLVHGGASGIGTTAIQLARAFGATVFATAGSDERCAACERLGAAAAINYRDTDFVDALAQITSGRGVDVILDIIGGDYLDRNLRSLAMNGRLVQIGLQGGARAQVNLTTLMQRRLTLTGSTLRIRTVDEKAAIARDLEQHVWPLLASGLVGPVVHQTFRLDQAADAHRLLESGDVIGKLVLTTGS